MGELVRATLDEIMQVVAERIALNEDHSDWIMAWSEISELYNEL